MALTIYTWTVIAFLVILFTIVYLDRRNFTRQGIIFLRKTQRGKRMVESLATKFPRFWKFYGNLGVIVFIPLMLLTVWLFGYTVYKVFETPEAAKGVGLVLPSFTTETKIFTGGIGIPFWHWIIALLFIAFVHEIAHAIIARSQGVKLKSMGGVLFGPILGAFVELDEKQMAKKDWKVTARIASAGALTNIIFFFILAGIYLLFLGVAYTNHGMAFGVDPNGPMNVTGISVGILQSINGIAINDDSELNSFLKNTKPGQEIDVHYKDENMTEKYTVLSLGIRSDNQTHGYMGILTNPQDLKVGSLKIVEGSQYKEARALPETTEFIRMLIFWLAILNFAIGTFNLIPAKPLDGGLIWESYARGFAPNAKKRIIRITNWIISSILILLIIGILRSVFM